MFGTPESLGLIDSKEVKSFSQAQLTIESSMGGLNDQSMFLEDQSPNSKSSDDYYEIAQFVEDQFERAKTQRIDSEQRWLECYRNFRGIYGPDVQFLDTEKSRTFIKITKTKVLAAHAQIMDVLFSTNKFPIGIESTPVPLDIEESVTWDPKKPPSSDDKNQIKTRDTRRKEQINVGKALEEKFKKAEIMDSVSVGPSTGPTSFTWSPAAEVAKKMERQIHDQLEEADAGKSLRHTVFEMCLLGSGAFKGPFVQKKEYAKWDKEGNYTPIEQIIPGIESPSILNLYPDPDAINNEDLEFMIQRHRLNVSQVRKLKNVPKFRKEVIDKVIEVGPNYHPEYWEDILNDNENSKGSSRYEVLEYWGIIDKEIAEDIDFTIPKEYKDFDEIQVNIWVCNGYVIRMVLNPFKPARIPYFIVPYELNPYSFFGIGVAENMIDTQLIMNGFMRLAIDNAALSGNVIFEVDEAMMAPGQDMQLYPGKTFVRQSGPPGQSIHATKIPNVTMECLQVFDKARQLADEATGMPSYSHGMTGVMGVGKTASGMSMLMGAAAQNIKAVVKNIDDYFLLPFGKAMFAFNMQFNFDKEFIGDLAVVAKGTESLMRSEIRAQKAMQFLQVSANPMMMPFVKVDYLLRVIAESLDIDPEKVINDPRTAALQAQMLGTMGQAMGQQGQAPQGQQPPGGPPAPSDPTQNGNGNIGPGAAPEPGSAGFSGLPQDREAV